MTEHEIHAIAEEAALRAARKVKLTEGELSAIIEKSVHETLTRLGIDMDKPLEAQKDFQWLRSWRSNSEDLRKHAHRTILGTVVIGILGLLATAFFYIKDGR